MRQLLAVAIAIVAVAGCGNKKKNDEPTGAPSKVSDAAAVTGAPIDAAAPAQQVESDCAAGKVTASVDDRYECTANEDCVATCAWGAVNYRASMLLGDDCDDGCAGHGLRGECIQSKCTTVDHAGKRADSCNDIATPEDVCVDRAVAEDANRCQPTEKLLPTWSRFSCKVDTDCVTSCKYGAINKPWYARLGAGCKDGCSSKGMHAKCVAARCVAFDYDDKRVDSCTGKDAPDSFCVPK